jgi:hypothetical protein
MRIKSFQKESPTVARIHPEAVRVEVPLVAPDDSQYTVILLDAEDSFDVIIHYPDSEREIVWSLVKEA